MPDWPESLPFFAAVDSMQRSGPEGAVLRTRMDKGPEKVRRRTSATTMTRSGEMPSLTLDQLHQFETFFREDLGMGAMRFSASDPLDGLEREFRFIGSYDVRRRGQKFAVTATLEILP
ncbi:hypothetical protein [Salipiger abyssi]|uniref:Uncharacterized protein n=1 Tax=Salipiger abyssi TaxID=1250539 RepID=A0A1P8UP95_9RHOB|nr:hypothetical protein [Salipiger abyssi]APZ51223.1 hypothetical protein Ga0080574_TMP889 [Salipiger abyssi]